MPGYLEVQRATCYGRMGFASEAMELWDQILGSMPESARPDAAVYRTRQAAALAAVEPERAVGTVADVAELVQETGSERLRRELLSLSEHTAGWENTAYKRELTDPTSTSGGSGSGSESPLTMSGTNSPRRTSNSPVISTRLPPALLAADNPEEAAQTTLTAITSGVLVPSNYWRSSEVITAVEARGMPEAAELSEAYRENCVVTIVDHSTKPV